jgi:hypothetical protein
MTFHNQVEYDGVVSLLAAQEARLTARLDRMQWYPNAEGYAEVAGQLEAAQAELEAARTMGSALGFDKYVVDVDEGYVQAQNHYAQHYR